MSCLTISAITISCIMILTMIVCFYEIKHDVIEVDPKIPFLKTDYGYREYWGIKEETEK